jgi:3-hydroxybutyryl-CoA dehydrogenase
MWALGWRVDTCYIVARRPPSCKAVRADGKKDLRMSTKLDEKFEAVRTIGVLGAGQMGGGIAQVAAASGFTVRLGDASLALAESGKAKVKLALELQLARGKMDEDLVRSILERIAPVSSPADFAPCDLVIEAATESTDLKLKLFKECDDAIGPGAWLASNTSSISITKLATATSRPDRVVGVHFMNPPPLMKLVEVVRGLQTSDETYYVVRRVAETMGKTVITSKDVPGFLVNRMLVPFLTEACFALQEGIGTPEDIDTGAKLGLNHPMGPLELADLIGLDTMLAILEVLQRELGDDKYRAPTLLRNLVAAGWYGKKSGRGFYAYDEKGNRLHAAWGAGPKP